jgi:hypothetical protein
LPTRIDAGVASGQAVAVHPERVRAESNRVRLVIVNDDKRAVLRTVAGNQQNRQPLAT